MVGKYICFAIIAILFTRILFTDCIIYFPTNKVGPIWVTGQRLGLTAFTIPFVIDRSYLVVPRDGSESLTYEVQKVLEPFSLPFWLCILLVIFLAAALSVWFWVPPHSGVVSSTQVMARKKKACCRLCFDSFLEKFTYFTSAGVEQVCSVYNLYWSI